MTKFVQYFISNGALYFGGDKMEDSQIVDLYWERSENAMNKHPRNMGTHTIFWNTKLNPHYYSFA